MIRAESIQRSIVGTKAGNEPRTAMSSSHIPQRTTPITAISLNLEDVKKIFLRLERIVHEEGDAEIANLQKGEDFTEEKWELRKQEIKAGAFRVTVAVEGESGDRLYGDNLDVFESPNRPQRIVNVYMTNNTAFRLWTQQSPTRSFELILDFSRPKLLDSENFVSSPTPNLSRLNIEGDNETWIASISAAVDGVLSGKSNNRSLLHRAFVYDFGLLIFGLPFAFYVAWKSSDNVAHLFSEKGAFLTSAAYVYLIFLAVWFYRVMFGYTKWAFPAVELSESSASVQKHRKFWYAIVIGVCGNFAWEWLKS
jgi:hypothetical protein